MRVPTQQDGSCTGRHSVFNVKLFTRLGSRAAPPGPGRRASPSRRCFAVPLPREEAPSHVSRSRSRVCLARRRRRQRNVTSTNSRGRTGRYVRREGGARIHTYPDPASGLQLRSRRIESAPPSPQEEETAHRALPFTQIHSAIPKNHCSQLC